MSSDMHNPQTKGRAWPRALRRGTMENIAILVIGFGVFMLVQPFSIEIYGWSLSVILTGTIMFTIVSKFPE